MRSIALLLSLLALPVHAVVPGVTLIRGAFTPGSQPDGNTIVFDAPEGLIVVDTGRHAAHTQQILDHAKNVARPIKAVINTHWHLDHIGGNAMIRKAHPGVKVYASDAIRGAMSGFLASYRKQLTEMIATTKDAAQKSAFETEVALIDSGAALAPDVIVKTSGTQTIAGRDLYLGLEGNAVTGGDVWVLDERSGVLVSGDLVTLPAPFLDTACPERWNAALTHLAAQKFDLLIPGHGEPLTHTQFNVYRTAFAALLACKTNCSEPWLDAIRPLAPGLDEKFAGMLMSYYTDLLHKEPPALAKNCN